METLLPRSEIVRLVRSLLGIQTTSGLAAQTQEQHITAVQMAAEDVAKDCRWVNAQRRVTVTVGAEQTVLNYPAGATPGSIINLAVYADQRYYALVPQVIPISVDTDQEAIAGGAVLAAVLGRPQVYEQREQINLWPRTDKAYPVRIEYMQAMNLPLESSISVVDAMLIVYAAASLISKQMENDSGAVYYDSRYQDRLGDLRAWQNSTGDVVMSTDADLSEGEGPLEHRPNWNTAATPPRP